MGQQLHKRFSTEMVQSYLVRYLDKTLELSYLLDILGIKRRRFFQLLNRYQTDPKHFSLVFPREKPPRTLAPEIEINIFNELLWKKPWSRIPTSRLEPTTIVISRMSCRKNTSKKYLFPPSFTGRRNMAFIKRNHPKKLMTGKLSPTIPENSSSMIPPITAFHPVPKTSGISSPA